MENLVKLITAVALFLQGAYAEEQSIMAFVKVPVWANTIDLPE